MPDDFNRELILARARIMRRSPTLPEALVWQRLRCRPQGLKFRRQHPFGNFIADFYCPAARLVVEVDGVGHSLPERATNDARRDAWMTGVGLAVVRIAAIDVIADPDRACEMIIDVARRRLPLHHASHGPPPQ